MWAGSPTASVDSQGAPLGCDNENDDREIGEGDADDDQDVADAQRAADLALREDEFHDHQTLRAGVRFWSVRGSSLDVSFAESEFPHTPPNMDVAGPPRRGQRIDREGSVSQRVHRFFSEVHALSLSVDQQHGSLLLDSTSMTRVRGHAALRSCYRPE